MEKENTSQQTEKQTVIVAGDVTIDWNVARHEDYQGSGLVWNAQDYIRTYSKPGGAALLADLIHAIAERLNQSPQTRFEVKGRVLEEQFCPDDNKYHHSYATWSLSEYDKNAPEHKNIRVWRVKNYLGLYTSTQTRGTTETLWKTFVKDIPKSKLIVFDDANLGFRKQSDIWEEGLSHADLAQQKPWIILKVARPITGTKKEPSNLWRHLLDVFSDRLILVTPVNEVRVNNAQISRELSWEQTAQDLLWELKHNLELASLSQCAHVIVSFGTAGALLLSNSKSQADGAPNCQLFFDPKVIEEMWGQNHPGGVVGYSTCLVASLAHQVMISPDAPNVQLGIENGLKAMRTLHKEGYGRHENVTKIKEWSDLPPLKFPIDNIATELTGIVKQEAKDGGIASANSGAKTAKDEKPFFNLPVKDPTSAITQPSSQAAAEDRFWMILRDLHQDLYDLAKRIVENGAKRELKDVPLGEFGDLLTADRREIEGYRSISTLVREYSGQANSKRPLSIAVFGPPGSGKSFGISEVAKTVIKADEKLTFNLSQFSDPGALLDALHQVRDKAIKGSIPLVFWDEFDTALGDQPLGWLRYFLAPMQDGEFQSGQITHSVGRAIFVFAGGTTSSRKEFEQKIKSDQLKDVKGPDFVSRLKGFIDIMGPDPNEGADDGDPTHIIRRALLLRSLFERKVPHLFRWSDKKGRLRIEDEGVLRAFLKISRYKHGVRSMESIIDMSQLAKKSTFDRSSLPPEAQLDLHVNGRAFLALVQQIELSDEETGFTEKLAHAIHQNFVDELQRKGYKFGPTTNGQLKQHCSMISFEELPLGEQNQNRSQARQIPEKLSASGYLMIPARNNEPPFEFSLKEIELLAEMEHERWMREKLKTGWKYTPVTDKDAHQHRDLLHWRKLSKEEMRRKFSEDELKRIGKEVLSEEAKDKDREAVRIIPNILSKIGYTIVKAQEESEKDEQINPARKPVVRVGVTGMRDVTDSDKIASAIASAIDWIERAFPDHQLAAVSTLAEGAERLVVKQILQRPGAQSIVILPLPEEKYESAFSTPASRQEFQTALEQADDVYRVPSDLTPDKADAAAGDYLLEHSDVLIAIWDGQASQMLKQTTALITKARQRDLPIVWISAGDPKAGAEITSPLTVKSGSVTFENF